MRDSSITRRIRRQQRDARRRMGPFAKIMADAMAEYAKARAAGLTQAEACEGIKFMMMEAWPGSHSPTAPHVQYACERCRDTGLFEVVIPAEGLDRYRVEPCLCPKAPAWKSKGDGAPQRPTVPETERLARDW